ncbi:MAG TPA: hypothetical protein VHC18_21730 [Amycolatopsis sp.]|nr:hypothetical protein [Amycolatopsis sp.]
MTTAENLRTGPDTSVAVANLIRFLETGTAPVGLFAPEAFCDLSLPQWRIQSGSAAEILAIRADSHPFPGQVRVERVEQTGHGFTIEFEERWQHEGQCWYCREMIRADVAGDSIVEMSVYCTGDWDEARQREHAMKVRLIRPAPDAADLG